MIHFIYNSLDVIGKCERSTKSALGEEKEGEERRERRARIEGVIFCCYC